MAKVIYVIPGFTENTKQKRYREVLKFFRQKNFKVIEIKIKWRYKVMSDYVKEFQNQYDQHKNNDKVYIFGFSFGAMISFIVSSQLKPTAQFLCSLSPYFKEDLLRIKKYWKKCIGIKRVKDLNSISFNELAKSVKCKTYILAGDKEGPEIAWRAEAAKKRIKISELYMINGAKHDISQKEYLDTIKKVVEKI